MQSRAESAYGQGLNSYYQYLAKSNEQQAELVKRTGEAQARITQDVAKSEGQRFAEGAAVQRASQKAALASSGVTGVTAEDVASTTLRNQMLDEQSLRYNYDVKSYEALEGAKNEAFSLNSQAQGYRAAGANELYASKIRSRFTLGSSLLGAAFSVANPFKLKTIPLGRGTTTYGGITANRYIPWR